MSEWIEYDGDDCPVPLDTKVILKLSEDEESTCKRARDVFWKNSQRAFPIFAYRVVEEAKPSVDSDGWIEWKGGACSPVLPGRTVDLKFEDGSVVSRSKARDITWDNDLRATKIIAYRVVKNAGPSSPPPAPVRAVLDEREKTHGEFFHVAEVAAAVRAKVQPKDIVLREAVAMMASKLGRIAAGDETFVDHWVDIAGYATLAADRARALREEPK